MSPAVSRLDLRALRQLADDVVDHMRRNRGRAVLARRRREPTRSPRDRGRCSSATARPSPASSSTLARIGMVLRRSTMRWTCPSALSRTERSMVTFIADNPNLSVTTPHARVRGRGLCQGVSAGARARGSVSSAIFAISSIPAQALPALKPPGLRSWTRRGAFRPRLLIGVAANGISDVRPRGEENP